MELRAFAAVLMSALLSRAASAQEIPPMVTARGAIGPGGENVALLATSGGQAPGLVLTVGKAKPERLYKGEAIATVEAGHDHVVVAYAIGNDKPFRIHVVGGTDSALERPGTRVDVPYSVVMTSTPTGFMVLFQDIEAQNTNEAHTYMVNLDESGVPVDKPHEIAVPWALGAAAWNGRGYHLALFYSGGDGVRLSMVSMTAAGAPEQHPDWSSAPGLVSDVHLVASGGHIVAYYRGGMGDRLLATDVTTIGQWGGQARKAKDLGALGGKQTIAITAKGAPARLAFK